MSKQKSNLRAIFELQVSGDGIGVIPSLLKVFGVAGLRCPNPDCGSAKIIKDGLDVSHSARPQYLRCKECDRRFYPHTSQLFVLLTTILLRKIVHALIDHGTPAVALAELFQVSSAFLSKMTNLLAKIITDHRERAAKTMERVQKRMTDLQRSSRIIYMDEMFFTIGRISHALIMAVDQTGAIIAWQLSRTRDATVIGAILDEVERKIGSIAVFLTDGYSGYSRALKERRWSGVHIVHVHSHPWRDIHLTSYQFQPEEQRMRAVRVTTSYRAFTEPADVRGWVYVQHWKFFNSNRPRGRPKGAKDKQPHQKRSQPPQ